MKAAGQVGLAHVVLVLTYADGFGVDFDQLGQRVLQAAGDTGRAAQTHVYVGHLGTGVFAGAVDGCACFADDHFGDGFVSGLGEPLRAW